MLIAAAQRLFPRADRFYSPTRAVRKDEEFKQTPCPPGFKVNAGGVGGGVKLIIDAYVVEFRFNVLQK